MLHENYLLSLFFCLILFSLQVTSCKDPVNPPDPIDTTGLVIDGDIFSGTMNHTNNPSGRIPLSSRFDFSTYEEAQITVNIEGDFEYTYGDFSTEHVIPILGLYPNTMNSITITATKADGMTESFMTDIEFNVDLDLFPEVIIEQKDLAFMEEGWHLCDFIYNEENTLKSKPFIFDNEGTIRWFIDFSDIDQWIATIGRLENGNWINGFDSSIREFDILGFEINRWDLSGITQHHDVKEMANGNLLIAGSNPSLATALDVAYILDRTSGEVVATYDIRDYLDVDRLLLTSNISDWYHMNAVWDDPSDGSVLISGKSQGVIKVSEAGALKYIIAPHLAWGLAGENGTGLNPENYLLTAVNESGIAYPDSVQNGYLSAEDFDWPWGQHACMIKENGNILLFDNGYPRNYGNAAENHSRAVEYEINESEMTIRQVWQYGKEEGSEMYSPIISDIDILPQTGNVLIAPGIIYTPYQHSRILELSYPDNQVRFDAELIFDTPEGGGWGQFDFIYRAERIFPLPIL